MEHNLHEGCKITLLPVMKCGFSVSGNNFLLDQSVYFIAKV